MNAKVCLKKIAQDAWEVGRTIDLGDCYYGEPHWNDCFVSTPCTYYYFLAGMVYTQGLRRILEIGTHMGGSISAMYNGIRKKYP